MSTDQWFDAEKIDQRTFAISEYGLWEEPHSYLFIGKHKALLIDTGLGIGNIKQEVEKLTTLPVQVILTHGHWDHTGGCKWFSNFGIHEAEAEWLINGLPIPTKSIKDNLMKEPLKKLPPDDFNVDVFHPFTGNPTFVVLGGEIVDLGERQLEVIHTPGHSPGSICLYEEKTGYLVTGDTLYKGKIDAYYDSTDPVLFAKSIYRLNQLRKVKMLLPGHHELNISVSLLKKTKESFGKIAKMGELKHGTGVHDFGEVQIHL